MMDRTGYAASDLFGVHGRTALITGGTSGIGYMMAEGLIVNGIGILVITGLDDEDVITQKTNALQTLADENHQDTKISGSVHPFYNEQILSLHYRLSVEIEKKKRPVRSSSNPINVHDLLISNFFIILLRIQTYQKIGSASICRLNQESNPSPNGSTVLFHTSTYSSPTPAFVAIPLSPSPPIPPAPSQNSKVPFSPTLTLPGHKLSKSIPQHISSSSRNYWISLAWRRRREMDVGVWWSLVHVLVYIYVRILI